MQKRTVPKNGWQLKNVILGGQDGVVNILGLVLGVAAATNTNSLVIVAGLASTFAESISTGAVAYTSSEVAKDYYKAEGKEHKKKLKEKRVHASPIEYRKPLTNAFVVGFASLVGSLIPLVPFFFLETKVSMYVAFSVSLIALFSTGAYTSYMTTGNHWKKAGIRMAVIGGVAALAGYAVGRILGVTA